MAKLTDAKVVKIKLLLSENRLTQPEIAKQFRVSRSLISNIATGRAYKKIEGPDAPPKAPKGQSRKLPEYDPTNERIMELEADVIHLREERNHARVQVKAASKTRGLFEAMTAEMDRVVKPYKTLPPVRKPYEKAKKGQVVEHLVLHISDGHHDQIVVPEECGGMEKYDFPTSVCRGECLIDTVLKWTQKTLAPQFKFPELTVLAYGDHTSGEIHGAVNRSFFKNQFKNSLAIGQFHALMYRDLAPYFDNVNVVYVPGNHGRRSQKKNHHGAHDNWDYLVAKTAEMYCRDINNIHFTIPNSFSINLNICGNGFCVFHGDDIRSNMGIPWYGLERRQRRYAALGRVMEGPSIRYFCCGHFHRPGNVSEVDGELLMNGPWVATDAYSYNALSAYSVPTQMLHGVNEKHGITWRLPIKLKDEARERKGPKRYMIDLLDEVG